MRLEFGRNIRLFSESLDFINLLAQRARQKIIFKSNELLIFFLNIYISHTYLSLSLNHFYSLDISLSLYLSLLLSHTSSFLSHIPKSSLLFFIVSLSLLWYFFSFLHLLLQFMAYFQILCNSAPWVVKEEKTTEG